MNNTSGVLIALFIYFVLPIIALCFIIFYWGKSCGESNIEKAIFKQTCLEEKYIEIDDPESGAQQIKICVKRK